MTDYISKINLLKDIERKQLRKENFSIEEIIRKKKK